MHGHSKFAASVEVLLRRGGATAEADFVKANVVQFGNAMTSPDSDLSNIKIPSRLFPAGLRGVATTAIPFWEHVIVPDCPSVITAFLRDVVCGQILHKPFMWADGAIVAWYNLAITRWNAGNRDGKDGALWHLGRCCHLIQDLCVPHHTTVFGNIKELYNAFAEKSLVQSRYEAYCHQQYRMTTGFYELSEASGITLPAMLINIANTSRGYMYLCDGITLPSWLANSRFRDLFYKLNKLWKEDFSTVAKYSNTTAEKWSTLLTHKFFRDISF
jgi:hypothetical protein